MHPSARCRIGTFALCMALFTLAGGALAQNWDGRLDDSFGAVSGFGLRSGKLVIAYPEAGVEPLDFAEPDIYNRGQIALQPDGRLIVAMTLKVSSILWHFGVLRLDTDGTLDTSFGNGGARRLAYLDTSFSQLADLAIRPNGAILLAGSVRPPDSSTRMAVAQLDANGNLDPSFGVAGWTTVPFGLPNEGASAIALQPDGAVFVAGFAGDADSFQSSMTLARMHSNGHLDTAFGNNGRVTVSLSPDRPNALATGLHVLEDGRILLAGFGAAQVPGELPTTSMALVRLLPGGSLDTGFGDGGIALFNVGPASLPNVLDVLSSIDVQVDGRILACGFSGSLAPANGTMTCLRVLESGQADPGSPPAQINFQLGYPFSQAAQVRIDPQGRALVAGNAFRSDDNADFALARLLPDGSLDPSFGVDGRVSYDRCPRGTCLASNPNNHDHHNALFGMALQPDDRIVMAGTALQSDGSYRLLVTRSHGDRIFAGNHEPPP